MGLFYYIFLYFLIYSILGWVFEVIYCSIGQKRFTNRGFLTGPYCPIYGFGALIIVYFLIPIRDNPVLVFVASFFLTSILEYITSFVMEKIFNTRWWDYSHYKIQINGRVCLLNSTIFGILGLGTMYGLHPFVIDIITDIPVNIVPIMSTLLLVLFTADFMHTVITLLDLKKRMEQLKELRERLEEKLDAITEINLKPAIAEILEKQISDLLKEKRRHEYKILRAFPNLKSEKFAEQIKELKKEIDVRYNKRKNRNIK